MAQPSPSEFLTFYRHITMAATRGPSILTRRPRCITASRPVSAASSSSSVRPFSAMAARFDDARKDEAGKRAIHKEDSNPLYKDGHDVQSENAQKGKTANVAGTGGTATSRRDETRSTERAKKDHPEAPDVVIGMQDERGQKGH